MNEKRIVFYIGNKQINGTLNDSATAQKIYASLPLEGNVNLWGKEIYFYIGIKTSPEDEKDIVNQGDIAYWPEGPALCIFFGPTPISKKDEIRPYSKVGIIGRVDDNSIKELYNIKSGEKITMKPITGGGA
ncbi:MAG TPA: cyclophilin-like fold protein [Candidatus Ratteibacteria bacterium]|uniref:Cyclophilin TM1367-like domain-containing protein n=1 Tax=candidate division TA06 bacterium ADurb.Bin131 TaxID=1852827 RepID=A0A1V6C664_UNCT6|nr:MAG: hypothetical protein BWX89_01328 [candidate division TA06 bacterium ADurb.Bin131]HOC03142.1 cyclophilin-like fold protein [bacterium]HON05712.1 cyclophilin-like fold protein [bacterium]HRS06321.1 cyclophilin-like fold protein [Candidatus Ratteibacteria bacterium]HRV04002.1 cyclophilin-like fold protein [Candidatus Ratteibacteria bacterium]